MDSFAESVSVSTADKNLSSEKLLSHMLNQWTQEKENHNIV